MCHFEIDLPLRGYAPFGLELEGTGRALTERADWVVQAATLHRRGGCRTRRGLIEVARLPRGRLQFRELEEGTAFELLVNGTLHTVDAEPQTPLLWVIRDHVGLTGTKFSCGIGQCGACTRAMAIGKPVLTIEGVSPDGSHPIQVAWKEFDAPQCGYGQSGMIMSALALLQQRPTPSDADIEAQVTNVCRCGTYHRVRQAIHLAADPMKVSWPAPRTIQAPPR